MKLSRQFVICLFLAVDSQKAMRLHSHHKSNQRHNDLVDTDWEDTMMATGAVTDNEVNQQTLEEINSEPSVKQVGIKEQTALQTKESVDSKITITTQEVKKTQKKDNSNQPIWKKMAAVEGKGIDEFADFNLNKPSVKVSAKPEPKELTKQEKKEEALVQEKQKEENMIDSIIRQRNSLEDGSNPQLTKKENLDNQYVKAVENIELKQQEAKKSQDKKFTLTVKSTKSEENVGLYDSSVMAEATEEKSQNWAPNDYKDDDALAVVQNVPVLQAVVQEQEKKHPSPPAPATPSKQLAQNPNPMANQKVGVDHPTTFLSSDSKAPVAVQQKQAEQKPAYDPTNVGLKIDDSEEDQIVKNAALSTSIEAEHDQNIQKQIKGDFDHRKKINMAEELKLLHSTNVDSVMAQQENEEEDTDSMSVMDAFRQGQSALEQTQVPEGPKSNIANLVEMQVKKDTAKAQAQQVPAAQSVAQTQNVTVASTASVAQVKNIPALQAISKTLALKLGQQTPAKK